MENVVTVSDTGLFIGLLLAGLVTVWTTGRLYWKHIHHSGHPLRGAGRAIVSSIPVALLTLGIVSLPGLALFGISPPLGAKSIATATQYVVLGLYGMCVLLVFLGFMHAQVGALKSQLSKCPTAEQQSQRTAISTSH